MTNIEPIEHVHHHPWLKVVHAFFNKHPSAKIPEVLSVEVKEHDFDEQTRVLRQTRLITVANTAPRMFRMFFPFKHWTLEETSETDYAREHTRCRTANLDFTSILRTHETSEFWRDPDDASKTHFRQTGGIAVSRWIPMHGMMERYAVPRVRQAGIAAAKSLDAKLETEPHIPPPPSKGIKYATHKTPPSDFDSYAYEGGGGSKDRIAVKELQGATLQGTALPVELASHDTSG